MPSFILDLVKFNEKIDYTFLIPLVLGYILLFWFLVSIWVYTDTKKRISKKGIRILFLLLNLIFGIPFLLLYLLARPYDNEESEQIRGEGGINIPIVNFVGKEGIVLSLELKMHPGTYNKEVIQQRPDAQLKIDVNMDTKDGTGFDVKEVIVGEKVPEEATKDLIIYKKEGIFQKLKSTLTRMKVNKKKNSEKKEDSKTNISLPIGKNINEIKSESKIRKHSKIHKHNPKKGNKKRHR